MAFEPRGRLHDVRVGVVHRSGRVRHAETIRRTGVVVESAVQWARLNSVQLSNQVARQFVLGKQGLWPGRRGSGKAGTRAAVIACEHLQLDPLVIVARSHDLMLHSRVVDYAPPLFDALAYEERLFFDWGGWLAVRSMAELPYWRCLMQRHRDLPKTRRHVDTHGDEITAIRNLLEARGTLANRDFNAADRRAVASYRGTKDSSLILYYLWLVGDAMTHHRDGFERVYAPTEAVAPAHLVAEAGGAETDRFMARKAVAFAGIGRIGPLSRTLARTVPKEEERRSNNSSWSPARSSPSKSKVGPAPASRSRKMWTFSATWRAVACPTLGIRSRRQPRKR